MGAAVSDEVVSVWSLASTADVQPSTSNAALWAWMSACPPATAVRTWLS